VTATEMSAELWNSAARVLDDNWAGDHLVPSRKLYPHQWSWDTAFSVIGLGYVNPARAWHDLRTLFEAQWPDGRVPHIVFDPATAEGDYFPGPAFWNVPAYGRRPARSSTGLVHPPVHAMAAWEVYRHASGHGAASALQAHTELEWLYPRLAAQQDYLLGRRNAGGGGLASIVHPWESGLDNSPSWDQSLGAGADAARYVDLAAGYRDGNYSDNELAQRHGFVVECPAFNSVLGAAELSLAQIAGVLGRSDQARRHRERARQIAEAIAARLWNPRTRTFHARDVRTGRLSPAHCVSGLMPLLLPDLALDQTEAIMAEARSARFGLPEQTLLPVPSYDRTAPDFDTRRYWRGPIWINMNWLLRRGMLVHGYSDDAEDLRRSMLRLVHGNGHFEYFDPKSGEGLGAPAFSWTAALSLDLLADRSVPAYARV
jgi:glycogen debranching enzyme